MSVLPPKRDLGPESADSPVHPVKSCLEHQPSEIIQRERKFHDKCERKAPSLIRALSLRGIASRGVDEKLGVKRRTGHSFTRCSFPFHPSLLTSWLALHPLGFCLSRRRQQICFFSRSANCEAQGCVIRGSTIGGSKWDRGLDETLRRTLLP